MSAPSAGELAGRSENNRELLERLISNTAHIIKDQRRWFGEHGSQSPAVDANRSPSVPVPNAMTAVEAIRNVAFAGSALDPMRSSSPSMSMGRRPPDRFIASPPPLPLDRDRKTSPTRQRSPTRMSPYPSVTSMTPSPAWPRPLSPTSPTSPELAPPSSVARSSFAATSRRVSPSRDEHGTHHQGARAMSPKRTGLSHRALRTADHLKELTNKSSLGKVFVRWLGHCLRKASTGCKEKDRSIGKLQEQLALAKADVDLASARIEAAEAKAERACLAEGQEDMAVKLREIQNECNRRVDLLSKEAEEARVSAASALKSLEEARTEIDRNARDFELALSKACTGDSKLVEAQMALQEALLTKSHLQQELVGCKAAEEQREKENRQLREELMHEKTRCDRDMTNLKVMHSRDLDLSLQEQRREHDARITRLNSDIEMLRRELGGASGAKLELESIKASTSRMQETLGTNETMLRDQLESRFREIENLHVELAAARTEISRLQERLQMSEIRSLHSNDTDVIRHTQSYRLEEQLRDRAAAAAAAEAQLSGNHALMLKVEGDLEIKSQRIRWLEDECQRQVRIIDDLGKQVAMLRSEKEEMLKGSVDDRAMAAASEAQKSAASEKVLLLAQQLDMTKAEALDARVQLTELRSQLASTLARLEGKEDALLVLKEELARTREQLAAAEHLLSQRTRGQDDVKVAEDKQQLIDHLEARIRSLIQSLEAKDREMAELRAKLEAASLGQARSDMERDMLAKELKEREEEIRQLRILLKELEDRLGNTEALRKELELLMERLKFAESKNNDQADEIARLRAELENANKALDERTKQVAMLTEELRSQMLLSETLSKSANASMLMLVDYEAQLEKAKTATKEAEQRLDLVHGRCTAVTRILFSRNKSLQARLAKLLERKTLAQRLHYYWTGLAMNASRKAQRRLRLMEQEGASWQKAANRVQKMRASCCRVLQASNARKLMSKCYWKLYTYALKRRRSWKTKRELSLALTKNNQKAMIARRFITWLAYTMKNKKPVTRRGKIATGRLLYTVKTSLMSRYFALWQRWRLRRVGRRRVGEVLRRNQNILRRRCMFTLLKNCLDKLHAAMAKKTPLYSQDRSDKRLGVKYSQTRRNTAGALGSSALQKLAMRYLNKWKSAWENVRLSKMTTRMQKIETMLIGKERLNPYEEPRHLSLGLPVQQAPTYATTSHLLQQDELIDRLELQRQEAASALKLGMVSADLRAGCIAGSLLSSELCNAFYNMQNEEARQRMCVELEQQYCFMFLLQDSLWESQMGWNRSACLLTALERDADDFRNQAAVLRDHMGVLQGERDALTSRTMNETKRADMAEAEMNVMNEERGRLMAENLALSQQLEATALHLSDTKQLLENLRGDKSGMLSENGALSSRLRESDGRYQELQGRYKELQERLSHGDVQQRAKQRFLEAKLDEAEETKRELDCTNQRLGRLSVKATRDSAEFDHIKKDLALRDETIAQLEMTIVGLRDTLGQTHDEATQQLLEDQDACYQEMEALRYELERVEKYNEALKSDNDRLRKVVVQELARMKIEGDIAACIQSEGITRLEIDRDELACRVEFMSFAMKYAPAAFPTVPGPVTTCASDIKQEIEEGRTANLFASRQARSDLILRLDAEWRQNEEMWLTKLDKLVNDWRGLSVSDVFATMPQHQQGELVQDMLRGFSEIADESDQQRKRNTLLADSLTEFENGLRTDESHLLAEISKRRRTELSVAQMQEFQDAEVEWSTQIEQITAMWAAKSTSLEFTSLSPEEQLEVSQLHNSEIEQLNTAVETNKQLLQAAQQKSTRDFEGTIKQEGKRLGTLRRRREELIELHIDEMQRLSSEWGEQLFSFIHDLSSRVLDNVEGDELVEYNVQIYRAWTQHEVHRRQVLERHECELLELEQQSHEVHNNTEGDAASFERLAFILNTRPKIMAFVSDSYRLVVSSKKSMQQVAELFLQLPAARLVAQSLLAPLQKVLSLAPQKKPRGASPNEEEGKWQQLASLNTRSSALRKRALEKSRQSVERSATPRRQGEEDDTSKQRATQMADRLEGSVTTINQLEALLRHTITQYMTDLERHQFGIEGFTSYQDEKQHTLRSLPCSTGERKVLVKASQILFSS